VRHGVATPVKKPLAQGDVLISRMLPDSISGDDELGTTLRANSFCAA
jgi:hypothetical protein